MKSVFIKELTSFFNALTAFLIISLFLIAIGLLMWVFPSTSVLDYGFATMDTLFALSPYVLMFIVPAITMRSIAEEKKAGTLELLLTKPITSWGVILGKYLAIAVVLLFTLFPTIIYYISIHQLGNPIGNIDTPGVIGSYVGLLLLALAYSSIGLFSSSLTDNQIISFIIAVFISFIFFLGFDSLAEVNVWGTTSFYLEQLGFVVHYDSLSKGLLDLRDVVYFLSVIFVFLLFTHLNLNSRKW
ncbi:MAG TPA: gliding motility-associated ABC transporter permease subunit GldF [Cyclobacteriaceae bacterium]